MESSGEITQLLSLWAEGDPSAEERLMPLVYQELRQIAQYHWNGQPEGHTLQPTALIHEAYLKLAAHQGKSFECRKQFFVLASMAMRQVLVNHAEARLSRKRGGGAQILSIDKIEVAAEREAVDVLALHEAMKSLHVLDARKSRIVELRYFGGLTIEETAEALGISEVTVTRDWRLARAFLYSRLEPGAAE